MKIVNKSIKKVDSIGVITGIPSYTDDLCLNNNPLIIKILRSPHAFAKIKSINTDIAKKVPGVEAIFTHFDTPKTRFTLAGQGYPEPSPYDRRILDEYVRYVGDAVAIIAAEDEKSAKKAMKLIKVEYEILDAVIDYEKATESKTIVHPEDVFTNFDIGLEKEKNIASKYFQEKPGVEDGFKNSDVVIERTYYTQPQIHAMMETYRSLSYLDTNGRLTVISSTQIPFHVRRHLARALEIPAGKIRVIKPRIGGGFGGKQTAATEIYSAFVTLKTGKPSKIIYDRRETHTCTTTRHAMRITVKIGSDLQGNIKAIDINTLSNTGAYGEHAPTVTPLVAFKTFPLYDKVPMRLNATIVYSNTTVGGAFRGYGATQGTFAVESAINELAHELKLDSTEVRLKNLVEPSPEKYVTSGDIKKCVEIGKESFNWKEKSKVRDMGNGKVRAAGMAVTMQGSGIGGIDTAAATIKFSDRGDFNLFVGVTDMGQGCDTILSQMAAEILEVPLEKIIIHSADTDISPYDPGAYASSGTYVTGNAVIIAAEKMKNEILKGTSKLLNIPEDEINYSDLSLEDLGQRLISYEGMNQITTTGTWGGPKSPPPFIAGFAEVEVDTFTGEIEVLDFLSVVDCGTRINPNLAQVQVEGGTVQGIGLALTEDIQFNKNGKLMTDTLMQYKIPSRKDFKSIRVEFVDSYEASGPFGAKSIGEIVINSPAPAIADAVYKASGVRVRNLPITAEKVLLGK
ncbi:molybdopterin-dependent oxidoreductase [Cetobacterium sp. 2A]|uniref:xanthine dehydrogenase family protein molybdopterin-binding subunit n=1 Tax=Cetobacterium sp. 2A TaxID=2754723 RepID=UPI00163B88F9|nr:molybdopterin cofactor-binding domain-containing protein [Cetobacterium sp. 2A]MBC2855200.1 molybdopterin-dependent oxidoreductase [Cetobacterium sp. 2A]